MSHTKAIQEITQYIRRKAFLYLPDLDGSRINVLLANIKQRSTATIYRFDVSVPSKKYVLLVKAQGSDDEKNDQPAKRPRLHPWTESIRKERLWYEYKALHAMQCYFDKLGDPRFGAVQVFDFLPDLQAFVMAEVRASNLRLLLNKSSRLRPPFEPAPDLTLAFFNSGAWLKAYSMLPKNDYVTPHNTHRAHYIESIMNYSEYLTKTIGNAPFFRQSAQEAVKIAHQEMPEELPLALGHGDYAARNILVGPGDRVTVLDSSARWRVPIYEDISYFLSELETNWFQVFTQGWAFNRNYLERYERAFLKGYFDQCQIPLKIIRLFQIEAMLDKWASHASRIVAPSANSQMKHKKLRLILLNRLYRKTLERLLRKAKSL